jgi:hypothetical protein
VEVTQGLVSEELSKVSHPLIKGPAKGVVARVRRWVAALSPVDDEAVLLELDELGAGLVEEPVARRGWSHAQVDLECQLPGRRGRFERGREWWLLFHPWVPLAPAIVERSQRDSPQAQKWPELDPERYLDYRRVLEVSLCWGHSAQEQRRALVMGSR